MSDTVEPFVTAEREFPRPVVCVWCGNRYRAVVPYADGERATQGDCCAAIVFCKDGEWFVQGCYGSTNYDTDRFKFIGNSPWERADPVCDNCIGERICAGDLERVPGRFP